LPKFTSVKFDEFVVEENEEYPTFEELQFSPIVIPILQNLTTDRVEYHIGRVKGKIWQEFIR
jgi:hypothetical protein